MRGELYLEPNQTTSSVSQSAAALALSIPLAEQVRRTSFVVEGSSKLTLNDAFVQWQRGGAAATHISHLTFFGLSPGFYTVEAFSVLNFSEALRSRLQYKTMFYGTMQCIGGGVPYASAYNTLILPIALSTAQTSFSITVRVTRLALNMHGAPTTSTLNTPPTCFQISEAPPPSVFQGSGSQTMRLDDSIPEPPVPNQRSVLDGTDEVPSFVATVGFLRQSDATKVLLART